MNENNENIRKKHTVRNRILAVFIILILLAALIYMWWITGVRPYADPQTTGNTSTNLLNGGLFTECDGTIYFANPYDENALYSMDTDLKHAKKIYRDNVSYINAAGNYIFYTRRNDKKGVDSAALLSLSTTGLYRIRKNGKNLGQLYNNPTQTVNLFGNEIYYQHYDKEKGLQLYRVGIDGKKDTMLLEQGASPQVIRDGTIYYTGVARDHNIYAMNLDGTASRVLCEGNFTSLSYSNDALYCMDLENDYTLCRLDMDGSNLTHLTQERIATYNISENGETVYYQLDNGSENGLYALDIATGTQTLLREGNYNFFHIIGNRLFFETFDGSELYVMDTSSEQIQEFKP